MRFDSSSLFVNTGKKPLPAMQKRKKKNNKNNIFLILCIAVITVLCIFVGLIVRVWINYNADESNKAETVVSENITEKKEEKKSDNTKTASKKDTEKTKKTQTEKKKDTAKQAPKYVPAGTAGEYSNAVDKAFSQVQGDYAYGMYLMNSDYKYINNTAQINNSAALSAFLVEYICAKIYTGEFDYDTNVSGYSGNYLIDRLINAGSVDAANILINYFTPDKLNSYMQSNGYTSTYFGGAVSEGNPGGSYTSVSDLILLMQNMYGKTGFFPYSDLYKRMRNNNSGIIRTQLPAGTAAANISLATSNEIFDAGVIYSPAGNYIFVSAVNGYSDGGGSASEAISSGSKAIYDGLNK